MSIVLIGARGCGKTTTGRKLADRLWQSFYDVDEHIAKKAGMTIREIFEKHGEERFRQIETQVLREGVAVPDHVIALGGGTLMSEENRKILKESGHKLIYLRCEPEELARRIAADPQTSATRPSLTRLGGGLAEIELLQSQREPIYRQCMHAELDVTNLSSEEAVVYIVKLS